MATETEQDDRRGTAGRWLAVGGVFVLWVALSAVASALWYPPPPVVWSERLLAALALGSLVVAGPLRLVVWLRGRDEPPETAHAWGLLALALLTVLLLAGGGAAYTALRQAMPPLVMLGVAVGGIALAVMLLSLATRDMERYVALAPPDEREARPAAPAPEPAPIRARPAWLTAAAGSEDLPLAAWPRLVGFGGVATVLVAGAVFVLAQLRGLQSFRIVIAIVGAAVLMALLRWAYREVAAPWAPTTAEAAPATAAAEPAPVGAPRATDGPAAGTERSPAETGSLALAAPATATTSGIASGQPPARSARGGQTPLLVGGAVVLGAALVALLVWQSSAGEDRPAPAPGGVAQPAAPGGPTAMPPLVDLPTLDAAVLVGPGGASGYTLDDARGVAVTQAGEVLVVEAGKKQVTRFDPNGVPLGRVGGPGDTEGQLLEPVAVAILDDGSLHVLDAERGTVQVYGPDGRYRERYGGEQRMYRPRGLARGDDDLIYVADTGGSRVVRFEANGAFHDLLPAEGADRALFDQPTAAVLSDGLLHVAEPTRQRLTILDPAGQRAATPWPMPETDTLRSSRLVIGVDGHLVITDVGARRIVIACSSDGPYLAWQPPDGLFDRMLAAALGPDRRLYIVDGAGRLARAQVELTC